jgi:hypothetical protein
VLVKQAQQVQQVLLARQALKARLVKQAPPA